MEISFGFLIIIVTVIFPGLIYRRLYYYGEFSKEFNSGFNGVSLLALASVPGIIINIIAVILYQCTITDINIFEVVNRFKEINDSTKIYNQEQIKTLNQSLKDDVVTYIEFIYSISCVLGLLFGRLIRIIGVDTRLKLFRFKNYWFYVFSGEVTKFKKIKHLREPEKKHLFTKADILVEASGDTNLYSGIVLDYELKLDDSSTLSKVVLQNAERYKMVDGVRKKIPIPGTLLVVDCSKMINLNLTYVNEKISPKFNSNLASNVSIVFSALLLVLIPIFIFKLNIIHWEFYNLYFKMSILKRIALYLLATQIITLLNPYIFVKKEYQFVNIKWMLIRIGFLIAFYLLYYFL